MKKRPNTSSPQGFDTLKAGIDHHVKHKITGWFVVAPQNKVYWCYSDGSHKLTNFTPEQATDLINVHA